MPLPSTITRLVEDFRDAKTAAELAVEPARVLFIEDIFRKNLILSAASLYEHRISEVLIQHTETNANSSDCVIALIKIKALKRQYHTFFDWDHMKIGPFFSLLGSTRGDVLKSECANLPTKECANAFLELGSLRNSLVHRNFALFQCDKTSEEIISLCEMAEVFVLRVESLLVTSPVTS